MTSTLMYLLVMVTNIWPTLIYVISNSDLSDYPFIWSYNPLHFFPGDQKASTDVKIYDFISCNVHHFIVSDFQSEHKYS